MTQSAKRVSVARCSLSPAVDRRVAIPTFNIFIIPFLIRVCKLFSRLIFALCACVLAAMHDLRTKFNRLNLMALGRSLLTRQPFYWWNIFNSALLYCGTMYFALFRSVITETSSAYSKTTSCKLSRKSDNITPVVLWPTPANISQSEKLHYPPEVVTSSWYDQHLVKIYEKHHDSIFFSLQFFERFLKNLFFLP